MSVLLLSDDLELGRIWTYALNQRGLDVVRTDSVQSALDSMDEQIFDLLIIDVYHDLDAIQFCRQIRLTIPNPVLLLTAKADEQYMLSAYEAGADDCILKPIGPAIFLAKVVAWMRQTGHSSVDEQKLRLGDVRFDILRRTVMTPSGSIVKLTNLESRLLHLLMSHPNQVLPSDVIVERVWGYEGNGEGSLLKNVVYRLRSKLEPDPRQPAYIQTVAGEGYMFLIA